MHKSQVWETLGLEMEMGPACIWYSNLNCFYTTRGLSVDHEQGKCSQQASEFKHSQVGGDEEQSAKKMQKDFLQAGEKSKKEPKELSEPAHVPLGDEGQQQKVGRT